MHGSYSARVHWKRRVNPQRMMFAVHLCHRRDCWNKWGTSWLAAKQEQKLPQQEKCPENEARWSIGQSSSGTCRVVSLIVVRIGDSAIQGVIQKPEALRSWIASYVHQFRSKTVPWKPSSHRHQDWMPMHFFQSWCHGRCVSNYVPEPRVNKSSSFYKNIIILFLCFRIEIGFKCRSWVSLRRLRWFADSNRPWIGFWISNSDRY